MMLKLVLQTVKLVWLVGQPLYKGLHWGGHNCGEGLQRRDRAGFVKGLKLHDDVSGKVFLRFSEYDQTVSQRSEAISEMAPRRSLFVCH